MAKGLQVLIEAFLLSNECLLASLVLGGLPFEEAGSLAELTGTGLEGGIHELKRRTGSSFLPSMVASLPASLNVVSLQSHCVKGLLIDLLVSLCEIAVGLSRCRSCGRIDINGDRSIIGDGETGLIIDLASGSLLFQIGGNRDRLLAGSLLVDDDALDDLVPVVRDGE